MILWQNVMRNILTVLFLASHANFCGYFHGHADLSGEARNSGELENALEDFLVRRERFPFLRF